MSIRRPRPNIIQAYRPAAPEVMHVEIHDHDCGCCHCPNGDALTAIDLGKLATAGAIVGSLIAFAFDPAGAAAALYATIGF